MRVDLVNVRTEVISDSRANDSCEPVLLVKKIHETTSNSFYIVIRVQNDSCEPVTQKDPRNNLELEALLNQSSNRSEPLRSSQPTPSQKLAAFIQFEKNREPLLRLTSGK